MSSLGIFDKETKTYKKVAGLAEAAAIDDALSDTSTNPVQNKVVKAYVDKKVSENVDFSTSTSKLLNGSIEAQLVLSNATRNLLNPTLQTTTKNGVTCTNNGDGTYTLNGTATATANFFLQGNYGSQIPIINKVGRFKLSVTDNKDSATVGIQIYHGETPLNIQGSIVTVTQDTLITLLNLQTRSGATYNNVIIKPMLTTDLNATYDDFVPYGGYEIKTCGKNLANVYMQTETNNGVTCTNNGDGTYTLNGTATAEAVFPLIKYSANRSEIYKRIVGKNVLFLNGGHKYNSNYIILFNVSNSNYTKWGTEKYDGDSFVVPSGYDFAVIDIHISSGSTVNNLVVKPMITLDLDATNDDFEPYKEGGTVHIDSSTEFPLLGLKSLNGITNIISPGNVEVTYAKSDSGKAILDMSENKLDKDNVVNNQTTIEEGYALDARQANPNVEGSLGAKIKALKAEVANNKTTVDAAMSDTSTNPVQNKVITGNLNDIRKETTVNLLNPTLETTTEDGITCTNNGDGTYTLNGTVSTPSNRAVIVIQHFIDTLEKHLNEELLLIGCPKHDESINMTLRLDNGKYNVVDSGNGAKFNMSETFSSYVPITIEIGSNGTTVNNLVFKPMITTNLNATYDDFVPYTGDTGKLNSDVAGLAKKIPTFERNITVFANDGLILTGDTAGRFYPTSDEWSDSYGRKIQFSNARDAKTHCIVWVDIPAHSVCLFEAYTKGGEPVVVKLPLFFYNKGDTVQRETISCDITTSVGATATIVFNPIVIKNV